MKITCPECSQTFDIPVSMVTPGGRRVRCSNCGHVWMQESEEIPQRFGGFRAMEEDDDIDPIPASVHPRHEDEDDEEGGPGLLSSLNGAMLGKILIGFVLAVALMGAVTYGLAMTGHAPSFLKPVAGMMGVAHEDHAAGLEFSDVTARIVNNMTVVTGKVTNTTEQDLALPPVEITPLESDGTKGEGKRITLPQEVLKAGENMTFGAELQGVLEADGSLDVRFVN